MRRRHHKRNVLPAALAASAFLHLIVGPFVRRALEDAMRSDVQRPVQVVSVSPSAWAKGFQAKEKLAPRPAISSPSAAAKPVASPMEKPVEERPPEPVIEEKLQGQVVEVPPTDDDSRNPNAKYLSKYNTNVEKETTARLDRRDRSRRNVTNELVTKDAPPARTPDAVSSGLTVRGDGEETTEKKDGQDNFVLKVPDILKREALMLDPIPGGATSLRSREATESIRGNSDHFELKLGGTELQEAQEGQKAGSKAGSESGTETSKNGIPNIASLFPNFGTLARISGSPSDDFVEGVEEGEGTFLNTKEFKYATFFHRVKHSVSDQWHDLARTEYRRRDPTGNIYGIRDRSTLVHVQLNVRGELHEISVAESCGVDFLDSVAIEAFKRAQPFPNPPIGIADADGGIRFSFQFIVTTGASRGFDIFR